MHSEKKPCNTRRKVKGVAHEKFPYIHSSILPKKDIFSRMSPVAQKLGDMQKVLGIAENHFV